MRLPLLFLSLGACERAPIDDLSTLVWSSDVTGEPGAAHSSVLTGGTFAMDAGGGQIASLGATDELEVWAPGADDPEVIPLPAHWDPGQVAIAGNRAWVVLRGTGAVLPVRLAPLGFATPVPVCPEPRGIGVDASDGSVWIACRTGELVHVGAEGALEASFSVDSDLRDVVVEGDSVWVSRFRTTEVLLLDRASGALVKRMSPESYSNGSLDYSPAVGWRMVATADGEGVLLLHQLEEDNEIVYYTTGFGCTGAVLGRVTTFLPRGTDIATGAFSVAVPYDLAVGPQGKLWVAYAATSDGTPGVGSVALEGSDCTDLNVDLEPGVHLGSGIAAASDWGVVAGPASIASDSVPFYSVGVGTVACASCHPDGGDDGHSWTNAIELGIPLRTMRLDGPLRATAPFHWAGDEATFGDLWEDVAVLRMGLSPLGDAATQDLLGYLANLSPPVPPEHPDPVQVHRGEALFSAPAVGCAGCHVPPSYTDPSGTNHEVGTGGSFQVPSLVGVSARLPVMHDGCAATLRQRFDPECGGETHGMTQNLADEDIDDLVAFLQTL